MKLVIGCDRSETTPRAERRAQTSFMHTVGSAETEARALNAARHIYCSVLKEINHSADNPAGGFKVTAEAQFANRP